MLITVRGRLVAVAGRVAAVARGFAAAVAVVASDVSAGFAPWANLPFAPRSQNPVFAISLLN